MQLILIVWVLNELFEVQVGLEALLMLQCFNISAATVFFLLRAHCMSWCAHKTYAHAANMGKQVLAQTTSSPKKAAILLLQPKHKNECKRHLLPVNIKLCIQDVLTYFTQSVYQK